MVINSVLKDLSSMASDAYNYASVTDRNLGILTADQQETIRNTRVALAGTGGNADILFTLVQLGFRHLRIADPDTFEASNLNRQLGAYVDTIGCNKAQAVAIELRRMAPDAEVEVYSDGVTMDNVSSFVEGLDIVIDGIEIEVMKERKALFDEARERGIPVFTSPAVGYGAGLAVFDPIQSPTFEEFFGEIPEKGTREWDRFILNYGLNFIAAKPTGIDLQLSKERRALGKAPAIAIGCRIRSSMVATAILAWLFHPDMVSLVPTTIYIDLLKGRFTKLGPLKRRVMKAYVNRMLNVKTG